MSVALQWMASLALLTASLHFIFARTATHVEIHRTACIASKDHKVDDDGVQRRLLRSTMWMPDGVWRVPATQARARGDTLLIALLPSQRLRGPSPPTPPSRPSSLKTPPPFPPAQHTGWQRKEALSSLTLLLLTPQMLQMKLQVAGVDRVKHSIFLQLNFCKLRHTDAS